MNKPAYNLIGAMMEWEGGELDESQELELFRHLLSDGTIHHLQGMYGRRAQALINAGLLTPSGLTPDQYNERKADEWSARHVSASMTNEEYRERKKREPRGIH